MGSAGIENAASETPLLPAIELEGELLQAVGKPADARTALEELVAALPEDTASDWRDVLPRAHAAERVRPEWLIDTLRAELPEDGVVFADASEMGYRMHFDYPAYAPPMADRPMQAANRFRTLALGRANRT